MCVLLSAAPARSSARLRLTQRETANGTVCALQLFVQKGLQVGAHNCLGLLWLQVTHVHAYGLRDSTPCV